MNRISSRQHTIAKHDSFHDQLPVVTTTSSTTMTVGDLVLNTLFDDVQLHILSFLSVSEARQMALVSKYHHCLLHSQEALKLLWTTWFQRQWPNQSIQDMRVNFVDLLEIPTALVDSTRATPNMSFLMGMSAKHCPTAIDESLQVVPQLESAQDSDESPESTCMFRTLNKEEEGTTLTQYLGPIGTDVRCIRANKPLSGPAHLSRSKPLLSHISKLGRSRAGDAKTASQWRPFVSPYVTASDDSETQIHLTPRLVSYYEVSILSCPEDSPLIQSSTGDQHDNELEHCVAIGVATEAFDLHSEMPGWDTEAHSFAYHGDDGGIFHGSGDIIRRFGPSFGQGDTIGCGIDYVKRGIFFTLNGAFLGYAWTGVDKKFLKKELFPTIGVDANWPIQCNFGERPFEFDLTSVVKAHKEIVKESCVAPTMCRRQEASPKRAGRRRMKLKKVLPGRLQSRR